MIEKKKFSLFWLRRDLRLDDNAGLYHALKSGKPVLLLFIFDKAILDKLQDKKDPRVSFIHNALRDMSEALLAFKSTLIVKYGNPIAVWKEITKEYDVDAVYTNRDYEVYAKERDDEVKQFLSKNDISFKAYKDHVIFDQDEVMKKDGLPYTVFTPYAKIWKAKLLTKSEDTIESSYYLKSYPCLDYASNFAKHSPVPLPSLKSMGFGKSTLDTPPTEVKAGLIKSYASQRDLPAVEGTSRLGIHFRFGTISIREKARRAATLSDVFLSELIWRDFYANILNHFPHVENGPFRAKYESLEWVNNEDHYRLWKEGKTGYPIVDAGMRELMHTGHMHNRVRMVVASFLTKHLLIDWSWGEAYFAEKLLDFDLASNNGGWQWAAGCGTDAAPYFRIFNPYTQQQKFDKNFEYVKRWVPEFGTELYPEPIIDHKQARERCLKMYKTALN